VIYDGLRVLDTSEDVAGAYCAKLLADLGADVVATHEIPRDRSELFTYLRTSQQIAADSTSAVRLLTEADIVIGGLDVADGPLVRVAISAFGAGGPDSYLDLPEPVLQARSGALSAHGHLSHPPLTLGGELGEYVTGVFAALGAATAWWRASRTGTPELVDVSKLEAMQLTMVTTPTLMANFPGGRHGTTRWVMIPGNEPCKNGQYVGITTVTSQQWLSLLRVIGRDDLTDDKKLTTMIGRFIRADEVNAILHEYTEGHTADEVVAACAEDRVPAAIVGNGAELPRFEQLLAREVFVGQPGEGWIRPRAPFRLSGVADRQLRAPEVAAEPRWSGSWDRRPDAVGERPFAGVTFLDFTAFWSGPCATAWFASMGADVIKVESAQRPDGIRLSATVRPDQNPRFYELSPLFHAANLGKRGITLDLNTDEGLELVRQLVATVDVIAENFTPRVMDAFGLDYDAVTAINPSAVMLRLPAFGLSGPWRDRPGFAQTMEQLTGMAWVTGYDGGPPIIPGGFVDPLVGAHAALALVAALEHRGRTGQGQLVEMPMIEVAAAVTAEQVIAYSAHGSLIGRRGAGGVFRCRGDESWIAIDEGSDPLDADARATWCAERDAADAVASLQSDGIAAAEMVAACEALEDPQHRARRFFQAIDHPDAGLQHYPGWPLRLSEGPSVPWTGPAPQLGQHTEAVLREKLHVDDRQLELLRQADVIGTSLRPS
jgi:crotonobetainyl-CoA:carnitine CoA-transferase CaiB-like acyl-CoA transferase